jgi:hypothetical protein
MTAAASIDVRIPGEDEYAYYVAMTNHDRAALARAFASNPLLGPLAFHRRVTFTTDDNTAAASSPILNLTNSGISFDANTERYVVLDVFAANGANRYRFQTRTRVLGSATAPAIKGTPEFLTRCKAVLGFATADGTATTEAATECLAPAWWDGAAPLAADVSSNAIVISWLGTAAPVGLLIPGSVQHFDAAGAAADARSFQHGSVNLTTGASSVFVSDVATPTAATWSNASAVRIEAEIMPPIDCLVLADTSPTPDAIFIGAKGLASDLVTWEVDVYVSDPKRLPLL